MRAWEMDAAHLPESAADRERLARAFTRESALWPAALLVRTARLENAAQPLAAWLDRVDAPVAVEVEPGSPAERLSGTRARHAGHERRGAQDTMDSHLGPLADGLSQMEAARPRHHGRCLHPRCRPKFARPPKPCAKRCCWKGSGEIGMAPAAWRLCRTAARRSLDDLAARTETLSSWDDLVLPDGQVEILHQIVANARQSALVLDDWGFAGRYSRGLGLSALFAGPSGTGKTMAAGILARELDRDLYQIDLATVVSKYIGETEKHLAPRSSTPPSAAARSCSSTRPTRSSASAARCATATTATPTSRSATCCSAWSRIAASPS